MEVVTLSRAQVRTLERMLLNVLSGQERFRAVERSAHGLPERFLVERGWAIRGKKMVFTGADDQARAWLAELSVPFAAGGDRKSHVPVVASEELIARVRGALVREEVRPGVFSFPCCLRFGAAEFCRMVRLEEADVAAVESALRAVVVDARDLSGRLEATSERTFQYSRES